MSSVHISVEYITQKNGVQLGALSGLNGTFQVDRICDSSRGVGIGRSAG